MLRRRRGATAKIDDIDLQLLQSVDAGLSWNALLQSAPCAPDEAAMRVLRLIQQGHLEGKPGDACQAAEPPVSHSAVTMPPSAARSVHTEVTRARSNPVHSSAQQSRSVPAATSAPSSSVPPGKTVPPTALAAREALLRELATRRSGASYPPVRPSAPGATTPGYYSVQPEAAAVRPGSAPAPLSSSPPAGARSQPASSLPPGRYSLQPDGGTPSSAPPGAPEISIAVSLMPLIDELSAGQERERWCAAQLRAALEQEGAGQLERAIGTLQVVMTQLTDPRVRKERDRLQARMLKATSGVYRAKALKEERASRHKEAAESWRKVLEACPDDAEAALHAAACCMESGDLSQAGVHARRAVELAPASVTAHKLLLRFFRKTGMEQNANRERDILRKLAKR